MAILKECRKLHYELQALSNELDDITEQLNSEEFAELLSEQQEELIGKEFLLAMRISGAFEDLLMKLDKLEVEEGMAFVADRMRRNACELLRSDIIDVEEIR